MLFCLLSKDIVFAIINKDEYVSVSYIFAYARSLGLDTLRSLRRRCIFLYRQLYAARTSIIFLYFTHYKDMDKFDGVKTFEYGRTIDEREDCVLKRRKDMVKYEKSKL